MKNVAKLDVELIVEERNLLSVGYKNVVGARRASWRILSSIEQKEEAKGNEVNAKRIKEYRHKVESELSSICNDIMTVIDEHLIPSTSVGESTVFFYKMYDVIVKHHFWLLRSNILSFFFMYLLLLLFTLEYCRKGDYYRYLAEFKVGNEKKEAADHSMKAYEVYNKLFTFKLIFSNHFYMLSTNNDMGVVFTFFFFSKLYKQLSRKFL